MLLKSWSGAPNGNWRFVSGLAYDIINLSWLGKQENNVAKPELDCFQM
jgi:hypothetical protein